MSHIKNRLYPKSTVSLLPLVVEMSTDFTDVTQLNETQLAEYYSSNPQASAYEYVMRELLSMAYDIGMHINKKTSEVTLKDVLIGHKKTLKNDEEYTRSVLQLIIDNSRRKIDMAFTDFGPFSSFIQEDVVPELPECAQSVIRTRKTGEVPARGVSPSSKTANEPISKAPTAQSIKKSKTQQQSQQTDKFFTEDNMPSELPSYKDRWLLSLLRTTDATREQTAIDNESKIGRRLVCAAYVPLMPDTYASTWKGNQPMHNNIDNMQYQSFTEENVIYTKAPTSYKERKFPKGIYDKSGSFTVATDDNSPQLYDFSQGVIDTIKNELREAKAVDVPETDIVPDKTFCKVIRSRTDTKSWVICPMCYLMYNMYVKLQILDDEINKHMQTQISVHGNLYNLHCYVRLIDAYNDSIKASPFWREHFMQMWKVFVNNNIDYFAAIQLDATDDGLVRKLITNPQTKSKDMYNKFVNCDENTCICARCILDYGVIRLVDSNSKDCIMVHNNLISKCTGIKNDYNTLKSIRLHFVPFTVPGDIITRNPKEDSLLHGTLIRSGGIVNTTKIVEALSEIQGLSVKTYDVANGEAAADGSKHFILQGGAVLLQESTGMTPTQYHESIKGRRPEKHMKVTMYVTSIYSPYIEQQIAESTSSAPAAIVAVQLAQVPTSLPQTEQRMKSASPPPQVDVAPPQKQTAQVSPTRSTSPPKFSRSEVPPKKLAPSISPLQTQSPERRPLEGLKEQWAILKCIDASAEIVKHDWRLNDPVSSFDKRYTHINPRGVLINPEGDKSELRCDENAKAEILNYNISIIKSVRNYLIKSVPPKAINGIPDKDVTLDAIKMLHPPEDFTWNDDTECLCPICYYTYGVYVKVKRSQLLHHMGQFFLGSNSEESINSQGSDYTTNLMLHRGLGVQRVQVLSYAKDTSGEIRTFFKEAFKCYVNTTIPYFARMTDDKKWVHFSKETYTPVWRSLSNRDAIKEELNNLYELYKKQYSSTSQISTFGSICSHCLITYHVIRMVKINFKDGEKGLINAMNHLALSVDNNVYSDNVKLHAFLPTYARRKGAWRQIMKDGKTITRYEDEANQTRTIPVPGQQMFFDRNHLLNIEEASQLLAKSTPTPPIVYESIVTESSIPCHRIDIKDEDKQDKSFTIQQYVGKGIVSSPISSTQE